MPSAGAPMLPPQANGSGPQSQVAQPSSSGPSQQQAVEWTENVFSSTLATKPPTAMLVDDDDEDDDTEEDQSGGVVLFSEAGSVDSTTMEALSSNTGSPPTSEDESGPILPLNLVNDLTTIAHDLTIQEASFDAGLFTAGPVNGAETTVIPPAAVPFWAAPGMIPPPMLQQVIDLHPEAYEEILGTHFYNGEQLNFLDFSTFIRKYMTLPKEAMFRDVLPVENREEVTRDDLDGDRCDVQGINWERLNLTRDYVRSQRTKFESERRHENERLRRVFHRPSAVRKISPFPSKKITKSEQFFSFNRMNTRHQPRFEHFQLRNCLTATSRRDIFYATQTQVLRTDVYGSKPTSVINLSNTLFDGHEARITTLSSLDDVLIAGGFNGEYAMTNLRSEYDTPPALGRATEHKNGITNHIQTFRHRNGGAMKAAFCSNDEVLRILDCHTNTFSQQFTYNKAINCSSLSPNGRLRAVVGDFQETYITNAETGLPIEKLSAHTDDVFACAWADDDIHIATSAQDHRIVIWDARNWKEPVAVLESELAVPRSLTWSPVGGGPRVLISAESDDFVNVIDAVTWDKRQVLEFFGPVAGVAMSPDGSELFVGNADAQYGGIMAYQRQQWNTAPTDLRSRDVFKEWLEEEELEGHARVVFGREARGRRELRDWGGGVDGELRLALQNLTVRRKNFGLTD